MYVHKRFSYVKIYLINIYLYMLYIYVAISKHTDVMFPLPPFFP